MMFCISVYLFFLSPYFGIQRLILNPERCPSFTGLEKSEDLTWDKIFESLSLFSITKYGKPIDYRLPLTWKSTSFSYVSKKHMFKKAFQSTYANISVDAEVLKTPNPFVTVDPQKVAASLSNLRDNLFF